MKQFLFQYLIDLREILKASQSNLEGKLHEHICTLLKTNLLDSEI